MGWAIRVVVIVLMALLGKPPSALHDPGGYNDHRGCMSILGILLLIGIVLAAVKRCN